MIRAYLAAAALAALFLAAPLAAHADPANTFAADISPSVVRPPGLGSYTIDITNLPTSADAATRATVQIPSGFTVEVNPAEATIVSGSCTGTWTVTPGEGTIVLAAPDDGSALCPGGTLRLTLTVTSAPSGDATYEWTTALRGGGNFDAQSQPTLVVDGTPPETSLDRTPVDPSGSSSATFEFSGADGGAGIGHFECDLDGAGFATCSSPLTYDDVPDGAHTFRVRAVDAVGNVDQTPASFTWTIDTVHPRVTLSDKPPFLTNRPTATFSFSASKPGSTFECQLDGGGFSSCTSPRAYEGLRDGSHTFAVRASSLGNTGLTTQYTWTVDTVAPQTVIASAPPARSTGSSARFTFTSNEAGSTFACSLDSSGFTPCASPKTYSGLGDGQHVFRVQAVDAAGNTDASAAVYTWQIAGVGPPTVDLIPPGNVARLRRNVGYGYLQLRWRRPSDPDFDHVGVFVSKSPKSSPRTLVYSGTNGSYTNKRFKNGLYYRYLVVSYDHANNASRGASKVVPPSVLLRSPHDGRVVRRPPILRWTAVRRASFYNVQLFYRGRKVLSAWPAKPRQALSPRWTYSRHRFSLRRGTYVWWVWPGFGSKAKSRYGQLLGEGSFRVR